MNEINAYHLLFLIIIPLVFAIGRYFHNRMNTIETKIDESDKRHTEEINSVKIKLTEEYVTKNEFTRFIDVVLAKIDQSNNKFEENINRHYERLDQKIEELRLKELRRTNKENDK